MIIHFKLENPSQVIYTNISLISSNLWRLSKDFNIGIVIQHTFVVSTESLLVVWVPKDLHFFDLCDFLSLTWPCLDVHVPRNMLVSLSRKPSPNTGESHYFSVFFLSLIINQPLSGIIGSWNLVCRFISTWLENMSATICGHLN